VWADAKKWRLCQAPCLQARRWELEAEEKPKLGMSTRVEASSEKLRVLTLCPSPSQFVGCTKSGVALTKVGSIH